jgi:hypothetical protein
VRVLHSAGYTARRLADGLPEWRHAGLAVAVTGPNSDAKPRARKRGGGAKR